MKNRNIFAGIGRLQACKLTQLMTALVTVYPVLAMAQSTGNPVAASEAETIVISASRIDRAGFTAPAPTTVIGVEEFQARSALVINDVLYDLPSVRPSTVNVGQSTAGSSAPNLRGLNQGLPPNTRTLFLVDRRRFVMTNHYGQTDSNVIPTAVIARLETVTGGASAAWGSDAVAGVVNVNLKKKIEGFEGNIQAGQSSRGDNKSKSLALAWGTEFAGGRGQFMIAGEYSKLSDTPTFGDRKWGSQQTAFITKTVDGVTYQNYPVSGVSLNALAPGGLIIAANNTANAGAAGTTLYTAAGVTTNAALLPFARVQFGAGGVIQPFTYNTDPSFTSTSYGVGASGGWLATRINMTIPSERKNVFARATYDLTSNISGFVDVTHSESANPVNGVPQTTGLVVLRIARTNPFLQAVTGTLSNGLTLAQTMLNNNVQTITLGRILADWSTYRTKSTATVDNIAAGLNGMFAQTGKWSTYFSNGKSKNQADAPDNFKLANLYAATDPSSTTACNAALVSSYRADPGCVPINPFGSAPLTQAQRDYIQGTYTQIIFNKRQAAGLSVQGEPFSIWAGPVSLAGGLEWRKDTLELRTNDLANQAAQSFNYGVVANGGGWGNINVKSIPLHTVSVKEVFVETVVPLLSNLPFVKSLDLNAAKRSTDYTASGRVSSWKVGLTWAPNDDILVRGTKSQDIRVANLNELYTVGGNTPQNTPTTATTSGFDPLRPAGNDSYASIQIGNADLKPEIAKTATVGIVFTPKAIQGLSTSIDYWQIDLKNVTGQVGSQGIIDACFGTLLYAAAGPNSTYCQYIHRNAQGAISTVDNTYINLALRKVKGFDVELAYRLQLKTILQAASGSLNLRVLGSYLDDDISFASATSAPIDIAGSVGTPHWRWTLSSTYQNGPVTLNLQGKYVQSVNYTNLPAASTATTAQYFDNSVPSRFYTNASAQYTIYDSPSKGSMQVYGNINNLFDKDPPLIYATGTNATPTTAGGLYDLVGRAFVLGLRFSY